MAVYPEHEPARAVRRIERQRLDSLRSRMSRIRERIPALIETAKDVEERWFELDSEDQALALKIDRSFEYDRMADLSYKFREAAFDLLDDTAIRVCDVEFRKYRAALERLHSALESARAEEDRRRAFIETLDLDASSQEAIRRGSISFWEIHRGLSEEDFRRRFDLST